MWAVVTGFFQRNLLTVLMWAGIAAAAAGVIFGLRRAGRDAERVDNMRRQIQRVEKANETRREVADDHRAGHVPERVRKFYID